ncbi:MAG TPA: ATP-binding protein [Gaiellaceae bacterium]|nr:ATP-binding protein [Gaiellaceae bacterium]
MDELANPYRPGAGTTPPALLGRDDLIKRFRITLQRARAGRPGKSVMPVGLRGVGKTVLLNRFSELAEQTEYSVVFIEATDTGEFATLLSVRLRKVLLELDRGAVSRKVAKALRVLKSFTLQLPDGSSIQLDPEPLLGEADSGRLDDDLTDVLVAVGEAAADRSRGLLIAVDEVQYLSEEELSALIVAIHRSTQLNLPLVVVGAGLPQLPGLAGEARSYSERLFEFPEIGSLNGLDARAALEIPANQSGVSFAPEALENLARVSQGYPYFLQEWGYHVWNHAVASPIPSEDVLAVQPLVLAALDRDFFRVRLDRLTPKERAYLRAMADLGPGPHRSGDIAAKLGVRVESVGPRRSGLIRKGMIYSPAHGDTAFTVPLFDEFLRRVMP